MLLQVPVSTVGAHAPDDQRWLTLDDPVLGNLIARAQAKKLDPLAAVSRVHESRVRLSMEPGDLHSMVNASKYGPRMIDGSASPGPLKGPEGQADFWQPGFDATWEISLFAMQGRPEDAEDRVISAVERKAAMVSLLAEVARDYLELRSLRHRSDLAIDDLVIQQDVLDLTRSLADQGLATDIDLLRAQDQVKLCRARVAPIEDGIAKRKHAIAILLGLDPGELAAELDGHGPVPAVPSLMGAGFRSDLLRRRPDVDRAERRLAAANAGIAAALARDCPQFTLTGSFGCDSARFSAAMSGASRSLSGQPGADWDLLDFGESAVSAAREMGNQQQVLLTYQYTLLSALRDAEDALTSFREEQEREKTLAQAVDMANQALEATRCRYMMGTIDHLEVLGAERRLLVSQDALAQSRQAVALRWVALQKALGGGRESSS